MSDLESQISERSQTGSYSDTSSDDNAGLDAYQDEPLALPGENELHQQEVDEDGISAVTLDARLEGKIPLNEWCKCNQCRTDLLENAREYRCCWEVGPAMAKLTLDGSTEPSCVTQHQDYKDLTKRVVLEQVGPVLRDKQGRPYRRRAGQHINMYLRAVAYRWVVRWMCGYLGWEHTRPLSACVYHRLRTDYSDGQTRGYKSSMES
ncbi:uncharacterized protein LOC134437285 [Engraulis encrasicolus]|uniref:uncharacterized protein LOC134437285 n=1 Tax=Engraulis encrasicolus TaxID=184585 RepID=UPI002FD62E58